MKLTPLDIHHKEFTHALRGYNEAEVDAFLDQVADELERLFKENIDLTERARELEDKVRGYQELERTLHNTLVTAQKSADEIGRSAEEEAAAVRRDAELKAKEIVQEALAQRQKASGELSRLKRAEEEFRGRFKAVLEGYLAGIAEVALPKGTEHLVEDVVPAAVAPVAEPVAEPVEIAVAEPVIELDDVIEFVTPDEFEEPVEFIEPDEPSAVVVEAEPAIEEPAVEVEEPVVEAPKPAKSAKEEKPPAVVASLHLGDLSGPDTDPGATLEFDVVEFGFGEREDDIDIEEID